MMRINATQALNNTKQALEAKDSLLAVLALINKEAAIPSNCVDIPENTHLNEKTINDLRNMGYTVRYSGPITLISWPTKTPLDQPVTTQLQHTINLTRNAMQKIITPLEHSIDLLSQKGQRHLTTNKLNILIQNELETAGYTITKDTPLQDTINW